MASTLRDELASLKIDRGRSAGKAPPTGDFRAGRGRGIGFLTVALWLIPLGLVGAAATFAYRQYEQVKAKPEVSIGVVQAMTTGEAEKLLSAKGYLKSRHQAMIGAKVPGRVERMYVQEGSKVKKGEILAMLEHNDLKALLASRRAQVERCAAELAEARVDLKEKDREARRAARLSAQKMISIEEVEKTAATREMSAARVSALEAGIALARANIEETEAGIKNMHLYAPFDGTVVEKQGEEGEVITPSAMSASTGRSAVVSLADLGRMEVETDVAENLLSRIALDQPAEISVSAVPNKHYRGRLRQIIPMGDRARGTIKVKVEILDPDESLFPELVATVHFLPDKALQNATANTSFLFVPKEAIVEEQGHTYAWVVDGGFKVARRRVEVAPTNDDLARVESGLTAGESVVLKPAPTLRENMVVKVSE